MSEDADFQFALELQSRLNGEESDDDVKITEFKKPKTHKLTTNYKRSNPHSNLDEEFLNRTQNLVHPMWESLDPTPDVNALFGAFDTKFFQSRLKCVTLEWSKRMYTCAGICYSSRNRLGMAITIRLSEPLLKLRPRKDLVETLLHEMIHAYCFVLNIREGNGGHGPNFKKIMNSINQVAGTNITVYHTFHDEVNLYKQHWWRCNGSCQHRSPFFGYVKRTSNRAPGPSDQWWRAHLESCGGTFMKIKEPEKKAKPQKKDKGKRKTASPNDANDIRKFFNNDNNSDVAGKSGKTDRPNIGSGGGFKGPIKSNGGGTLLLNPKTKTSTTTNPIATQFPPTSYPGLSTDPFNMNATQNNKTKTAGSTGGNLRNVVSFGDLNKSGSGTLTAPAAATSSMSGRGFTIGSTTSPATADGAVDRHHLRDIWSKRFGGQEQKQNNKDNAEKNDASEAAAKRRRMTSANDSRNSADWQQIDDDVLVREQPMPTYTLSSSSSSDDDGSDDNVVVVPPKQNAKPLTQTERQEAIKQEIMDESLLNLSCDDIILIDDEFDDNLDDVLAAATDVADTSVIDEFFGDDTLLRDFLVENDVRPTFSRHVTNPQNDIVTCPVCQNKLKRSELEEHLDGCTGIAIKILPAKPALKKIATTARDAKATRKAVPSKKEILRNAGYSEEDLLDISSSSAENDFDLSAIGVSNATSTPETIVLNDSLRSERMRGVYKTTRQCPVCTQEIEEANMNDHLDVCLL